MDQQQSSWLVHKRQQQKNRFTKPRKRIAEKFNVSLDLNRTCVSTKIIIIVIRLSSWFSTATYARSVLVTSRAESCAWTLPLLLPHRQPLRRTAGTHHGPPLVRSTSAARISLYRRSFFFFFLNQLAVYSLSLSLSQRSHGLITGTSPAARGAGAHHQHELHTHVVLPGHRERCFASAKTPYCDDGLWPLHRCDAGWDREQCGWIKTRIKQLWWEVAWDCGTQYQRRRTACGADRTNALRPFYTRKGPCAPVGWQYVRYTFSLNHLFFLLLRAVTPATPKSSTLWVCFRTGLLPSTPSPPITQRTSQAATRNTGQCRQGSEEKTKADVALHFLLLFFCWLFPPMWIINTLE